MPVNDIDFEALVLVTPQSMHSFNQVSRTYIYDLEYDRGKLQLTTGRFNDWSAVDSVSGSN